MTQSSRTLLMLVALLAVGLGVGLYAWKGVYEKDEHDTKQKDVDEHLFSPTKVDEKGLDGSVANVEFVKLKLTSGGETSALERASGSDPWKMTSPVAASVDKIALDGITSQLQSSKFKYVADEAPDDAALEKYGLKKPMFVVEAEALVGDQHERRTVKLVGGAENTFNGSIFTLRNDEKKVWAAEGGVKWTFSKTPYDLRDKNIVTLDEQKVSKVKADTKNNHYALERNAEKNWVIKPDQPIKGEVELLADQGAISGSLNGIKNERATGFPPALPDPAAEPFEAVTFETETGTVHVKLWRFGGGDAGPVEAYLQREDSSGTVLAKVGETALSHFDRNPWDIRDKTVLVFDKAKVAKVTFHSVDGAEIAVEKESADAGGAENWRVVSPKTGPAKVFKIAAIMWALGSIKSGDIVDEKPKDLKKYGLDKPQWIAVSGTDGKELGRLQVGAEVKGKPGAKYMRGTREPVLAADASRLADVPSKVEDVLDLPAPTPVSDAGP